MFFNCNLSLQTKFIFSTDNGLRFKAEKGTLRENSSGFDTQSSTRLKYMGLYKENHCARGQKDQIQDRWSEAGKLKKLEGDKVKVGIP